MPQLLQLAAARVDQRPLAQAVHEIDPTLALLPASQSTQRVSPVDCWYLPAMQASQDVAFFKD